MSAHSLQTSGSEARSAGTARFGLDVATTEEWSDPALLAELASDAEGAGWDGFFIWDVLLPEGEAPTPVADPWISLAAIALRTHRIRIGALVTPLPRRHVWKVAREVVTLDHLAKGRVTFGAGLGWRREEFELFGQEPNLSERATSLDEALSILDGAWRGERVDFTGEHHSVKGAVLAPRPVQAPRPPIWIAAGWPRTRPLRRAVRWDGVYLMTDNQATGARISSADVAQAAAAAHSYGADPDSFDIVVNLDSSDLDAAQRLQAAHALSAAGATWVLELTPETLREHRELIRRGPPGEG